MDDQIKDEHEVDDTDAEIIGDHPDPLTLSSPDFDESGRLVWGSVPPPLPR